MFFSGKKSGRPVAMICLCLLFACANEKAAEKQTLTLLWPRGYQTEEWIHCKKGLTWSLSFIGAVIPEGSADKAFQKQDDGRIIFDPAKAGFNDHTLQLMHTAMNHIKESDEYKSNGAIDLGRFLVFCVYSSWNYFAFTGAEKTLYDFKNRYKVINGLKYAITNSSVSGGDRIVHFRISPDIGQVFFMAEEGTGSVANGTFLPSEYETITIMPNGQPRFAMYDAQGKLKDAAESSLSIAGKPGKCMWCHESGIQPQFNINTDVSGFISQAVFASKVDSMNYYLREYRRKLHTDILFDNFQDHTYSELLYMSFMEPMVFRLAKEWNMSESDVSQIISSLPVHNNPEFPVPGDCYDRFLIDQYAPVQPISVPYSVREKSIYEPDLFNLGPG